MGDSVNNLPLLQQPGNTQAYGKGEDLPSTSDPRLLKRKSTELREGTNDAFELNGQPGLFPQALLGGANNANNAGGVGGDDGIYGTGGLEMQDTGVQPGNGEMLQQLSQEYGPMGAMMMLLCSGGLDQANGGSNPLDLRNGGGGGGNNPLDLLNGGGGGGNNPLDLLNGGGGGGSNPLGLSGGGRSGAAEALMNADVNPELMSSEQSGGDLRNAQNGGGDVQYQRVEGSLWGGKDQGVSGKTGSVNSIASSVQQTGTVGDCYFLASLSAAAAQNPDSVKGMIRPDPNGQPNDYQVRFYAKDPQTQQMKEEWVSVNDELPTTADGKGSGAGLPKDSSGKAILGPALIEKAFAKFNDAHQLTQSQGVEAGAGYNGIGNGGYGAEAMEAITGKESSILGDPTTPDSLSKQGVSDKDLTDMLQQANPPSHTPTVAGTVEKPSNGIAGSHEYTVLGTYQKGGKTMVTLRNPWGTNDPKKPNDANRGVVSISLDQFKKDFGMVTSADGKGRGIDLQDGNSNSSIASFNLRNQFMRA